MKPGQYIAKVSLDQSTRLRRSPRIEHELQVALLDLAERNTFDPEGDFQGPFHVSLGLYKGCLYFKVCDTKENFLCDFTLSLRDFRDIIQEYFLICESYYRSIKNGSLSQIETIDMGRRGLHTEAAELLLQALKKKARLDLETARNLFTLICVLHIKA